MINDLFCINYYSSDKHLLTTILYVFPGIVVISDFCVTRPVVFLVYQLMTMFVANPVYYGGLSSSFVGHKRTNTDVNVVEQTYLGATDAPKTRTNEWTSMEKGDNERPGN